MNSNSYSYFLQPNADDEWCNLQQLRLRFFFKYATKLIKMLLDIRQQLNIPLKTCEGYNDALQYNSNEQTTNNYHNSIRKTHVKWEILKISLEKL